MTDLTEPPPLDEDLCAYCSMADPTERDHVVPKLLFPKPRPDDLITVPACSTCNRGFSGDEEAFRQKLSIRVGTGDDSRDGLWKDSLRTYRHNRRLRTHAIKSIEPVWLKSPGGILIEKVPAMKWNDPSYGRIISKIARGLFYHHFKAPIPLDVPIKPYFLDDKFDLRQLEYSGSGKIGHEQFDYRYAKSDGHPFISYWIFVFYRRHVGAAFIGL